MLLDRLVGEQYNRSPTNCSWCPPPRPPTPCTPPLCLCLPGVTMGRLKGDHVVQVQCSICGVTLTLSAAQESPVSKFDSAGPGCCGLPASKPPNALMEKASLQAGSSVCSISSGKASEGSVMRVKQKSQMPQRREAYKTAQQLKQSEHHRVHNQQSDTC